MNVTIFGESAGGLSVHSHLASPRSGGLFQRAIAESGSYALTQPTLAVAEAQNLGFATAVNCGATDTACLRALPVSKVLANQSTSATAYMPNVDETVLTQSIGPAFSSGQFNRVPVIEGSNHDDRTETLVPPIPQAYTATAFAADHKCAFWAALAGH